MIEWDRFAVEDFLGLVANKRVGVVVEYVFDLPLPGGIVHFSVQPSEDHCQFYSEGDEDYVAAAVQCTRIVVSDEMEEEGGQCVVLQSGAGHACVSPGKPYFKLFFSMYLRDMTRPDGGK